MISPIEELYSPMNSKMLKQSILLLSLFALCSCSTSYHFKVDAIAGGEVQTLDSFYVTFADPGEHEAVPSFEDISSYVQKALESKGFQKARDLDSADTLIVVSFGVRDPVEVFVERGSNSANLLLGPTYAVRRDHDSSGGVVGTSTHLVEVPPSQGSEPVHYRLERRTVFEKFLKLEAYDNRLDASIQDRKRLWSIGIANADQSDDIHEYLPIMLAVAVPYIAEETGTQISVDLKSNDPMIEFIRSSDAVHK